MPWPLRFWVFWMAERVAKRLTWGVRTKIISRLPRLFNGLIRYSRLELGLPRAGAVLQGEQVGAHRRS